jgi:hypothetical protein
MSFILLAKVMFILCISTTKLSDVTWQKLEKLFSVPEGHAPAALPREKKSLYSTERSFGELQTRFELCGKIKFPTPGGGGGSNPIRARR